MMQEINLSFFKVHAISKAVLIISQVIVCMSLIINEQFNVYHI